VPQDLVYKIVSGRTLFPRRAAVIESLHRNEIAGHQKKVCHGRAVKSRAQPSQDATSSNEQPQPETREHSRGFNEQQERQQEQDREQDHPGPEQLMRERTGSPFEDDQELESGNLSGDESGPFTSSNAPSQPTKPLPHRPFPELHSLFARERHHQNSNQWNFHRRSRVVLHKTGNERPVDPDSRHVEPQREPFEVS